MREVVRFRKVNEEEVERIRRRDSRLCSLAKYALATGVCLAAASGAVHYFGGKEYHGFGNTLFEVALWTGGLGFLPYLANRRFTGELISPEDFRGRDER